LLFLPGLPPSTPVLPIDEAGTCPSGKWERFGDSCFYVNINQRYTWNEAQEECAKQGGKNSVLASIKDNICNWYIQKELKSLVNIGEPTYLKAWIGYLEDSNSGEQKSSSDTFTI